MDRLSSMRVFSRVIEEGSFAGAARELNLSPAVVTRLIAELEEHLSARLINRTTRRLALTDAGDAYLARARRILIEVGEAPTRSPLHPLPSRVAIYACCCRRPLRCTRSPSTCRAFAPAFRA